MPTDHPDINSLTNPDVDEAIARAVGMDLDLTHWKCGLDFCDHSKPILFGNPCPECSSLFDDHHDYHWKVSSEGISRPPPYTTDPALTGDMLYGNEELGFPGLWDYIRLFHNLGSGEPVIWLCWGDGRSDDRITGQGDTPAAKMCSAVARACLVQLWEGGAG